MVYGNRGCLAGRLDAFGALLYCCNDTTHYSLVAFVLALACHPLDEPKIVLINLAGLLFDRRADSVNNNLHACGETIPLSYPQASDEVVNFTFADDRFAQVPRPKQFRPYLETSADVLTWFEATPGLPESIKAVELKRFALRQLLPLFEANLPERAEAMRVELNSLGVPPPWAVSPKETPGKNADPRFSDDLSTADLITNVKKIPDELEQDNIFFQQALRAYNRGDLDRARTLAAEITRSNSKEGLMTVITYSRAQKQIEKGELDDAEKTATTQLDRVRRAEVYAQLYKAWAERGDMQRANEMIAYAASEAAKVDPRSQRAQVYIYLASMATARDAPKAFEFLEAAMGDINAAEKFDPQARCFCSRCRLPKAAGAWSDSAARSACCRSYLLWRRRTSPARSTRRDT